MMNPSPLHLISVNADAPRSGAVGHPRLSLLADVHTAFCILMVLISFTITLQIYHYSY